MVWTALAKGGLVSTSRTRQGNEHFYGPAAVLAHLFLGDGVPIQDVILVPEPLGDMLSGEALLSGRLEIILEDAVDDTGIPIAVAKAPSANLRPPG